jgi:outer membrane protein OmpA-like peptidoglycan-associated protein
VLSDIAGLMKAVPDLKIVLEVSADVSVAAAPSKQLSDRQVQVLQKMLETRFPATKGRVFFRSLGNIKPIAKDVNARARTQNTRVEIRRVY